MYFVPQNFGKVEGGEGRWEVIDEDMFIAAAILDGFCNHFQQHPENQLYLIVWARSSSTVYPFPN